MQQQAAAIASAKFRQKKKLILACQMTSTCHINDRTDGEQRTLTVSRWRKKSAITLTTNKSSKPFHKAE